MTHKDVASISPDTWKNCVRHAEKSQEENIEREIRRDNIIEPFSISLQDFHIKDGVDDDSIYCDSD